MYCTAQKTPRAPSSRRKRWNSTGCVQRDVYIWKETYERDIPVWKENNKSDILTDSLRYLKRDLQKRLTKRDLQKRPTKKTFKLTLADVSKEVYEYGKRPIKEPYIYEKWHMKSDLWKRPINMRRGLRTLFRRLAQTNNEKYTTIPSLKSDLWKRPINLRTTDLRTLFRRSSQTNKEKYTTISPRIASNMLVFTVDLFWLM